MKDILTIKASNHLDSQTLLNTNDDKLYEEVWGHVKALVELGVFEDATNGIDLILSPYIKEVSAELA